ncbi:uncharacterized protein LOC143189100 [Rhynchophorus ferrugineus]|uniref:uncharacterized protein LOC143189100 n=1 Tax=Rhynchophorus ferrugineus TaxID=354439 RepID=UPI003FCC9205
MVPNLNVYKLQKLQLFTDENKQIRLAICRQLKRRDTQRWERILFTKEKLFTVEYNHQNDRSWYVKAAGTSAVVEHRQNPQFVMVWAGICSTSKTPLVLVHQWVKIKK